MRHFLMWGCIYFNQRLTEINMKVPCVGPYLWNVLFNNLDYSFHMTFPVHDDFNVLGDQL